MSTNYLDQYFRRVNRFGDNPQEKIRGEKSHFFEKARSIRNTYSVKFEYEGRAHRAVLKPNKQDFARITHTLLTELKLKIPSGAVLDIGCKNWIILYLKEDAARGYNEYSVLELDREICWEHEGATYSSLAFFIGPMEKTVRDTYYSNQIFPIYREPEKVSHLILPKNLNLVKDTYLEINEEGYIVLGYDISSNDGVMYVSLDHTMKRDLTAAPEKEEGDKDDDFFWLGGGAGDGD